MRTLSRGDAETFADTHIRPVCGQYPGLADWCRDVAARTPRIPFGITTSPQRRAPRCAEVLWRMTSREGGAGAKAGEKPDEQGRSEEKYGYRDP